MSAGVRIAGGVTRAASVEFVFEGQIVHAPEGESVAAALLAAGIRGLRDAPVSGAPRGAFCFMGVCQECVVEIDGSIVEACRVSVRDGLEVKRVRCASDADDDRRDI